MNITLNIWECIILLFLFYAFRWFFRMLVLIFILKLLEGIKRKVAKNINDVKTTFSKYGENSRTKN